MSAKHAIAKIDQKNELPNCPIVIANPSAAATISINEEAVK